MRDEHGVADEREKFLGDLGELRLARQKFRRKPMNAERLLRHVALGIEIEVKCLPGRNRIQDFDTADLDDPMAGRRIEAGGFRIEDDLTHDVLPSRVRRGCR